MDIAMVWVPPWRPWRRTSMVYGSLWYFWKMVFWMYAFAEVFGGQHDRASPEKRKHVCLLRVLRMPEKAQSATPYHASDRAGNPLVHMLFHNWILSHKWGYPVNQWLIPWWLTTDPSWDAHTMNQPLPASFQPQPRGARAHRRCRYWALGAKQARDRSNEVSPGSKNISFTGRL